jgi:hypothetical protein
MLSESAKAGRSPELSRRARIDAEAFLLGSPDEQDNQRDFIKDAILALVDEILATVHSQAELEIIGDGRNRSTI